MRKESKAARLRELIAKGCVAMPGVPNAAMARQVERASFDAVYISGAGLANATAGVPDIGLLTLTEVNALGWRDVTLRTRNFQNVADILPGRLSSRPRK